MSHRSSSTHEDLYGLRAQLSDMLTAIEAYQHPVATPPILEVASSGGGIDGPQHVEAVSGLRALKDAVRKDLDMVSKFLDDPRNARLPPPFTNAPYLVAVWNEVRVAPLPIVGIWKTFASAPSADMKRSARGARVDPGVKVDVVAAGGAHWIRVNTTKNARLLAELREIDSYCTDSEDESDHGDDFPRETLAPTEFDNSILRNARELLAAATAHPHRATRDPPSITLRLTRLNPASTDPREHDSRIARTIDELRALGIDVQLGPTPTPASLPNPTTASPRPIVPSLNINLDLSLLVAIISDLSHSPPPSSPEDAAARFVPPPAYQVWKAARIASGKAKGPAPGAAQHARALAEQAMQDARLGLLAEIRGRLEEALHISGEGWENVKFWTTKEARWRCVRIVEKIGGPGERRRTKALFPPDASDEAVAAEEAFWRDSRFARGHIPLLPIHIIPDGAILEDPPLYAAPGSFFDLLRRTCDDILADAPVPDPRSLRTPAASRDTSSTNHDGCEDAAGGDNAGDGDLARAAVTLANPRLTAHTVQSMRIGAARGWTTLTANRASVRTILREVRSRHGADASQRTQPGETDAAACETAALWIVEPRSLAEGMRGDREMDLTSHVKA